MRSRSRRGRRGAPAAALLLSACLSSAPPAPPVRWFDPLPPAPTAGPRPEVDLRVVAAPHLGREFVVRTAPREVVFDGQHGWIAEPAQLVASALGFRLATRAGAEPLRIAVEAFELDVQAAPRAVVRLTATGRRGLRRIDAEAPAVDRSPAAFAAAMALALDQALDQVAEFVQDG
ncbi:MAG: membrane integrity-associated transporter subunit PqiC [Planctomycetes bacterium]|nr:membrane integrity-associated transporter subunit PqiC [Planctomycetota bacterium]